MNVEEQGGFGRGGGGGGGGKAEHGVNLTYKSIFIHIFLSLLHHLNCDYFGIDKYSM